MKKLALTLLLFTTVIATAYCQTPNSLKRGNEAFNNYDYVAAATQYELFFEHFPTDFLELRQEILGKLAYSYKNSNQAIKAEQTYQKLIEEFGNQVIDNRHYLYYAQVLASNKKCKESQMYYSVFAKKQEKQARTQLPN